MQLWDIADVQLSLWGVGYGSIHSGSHMCVLLQHTLLKLLRAAIILACVAWSMWPWDMDRSAPCTYESWVMKGAAGVTQRGERFTVYTDQHACAVLRPCANACWRNVMT